MKRTITRLLSIMTLASSLSAFALSDKAKTSTASSGDTECAPASSEAGAADQDKGQSDSDQEKSRQMLIKEQEKQWLHDLQYTSAG